MSKPRLNCPTCQKSIEWSEQFPERPFCSQRCKLIDLGEWAGENHRIAGDPVMPDIDGDDWSQPH